MAKDDGEALTARLVGRTITAVDALTMKDEGGAFYGVACALTLDDGATVEIEAITDLGNGILEVLIRSPGG